MHCHGADTLLSCVHCHWFFNAHTFFQVGSGGACVGSGLPHDVSRPIGPNGALHTNCNTNNNSDDALNWRLNAQGQSPHCV
jgi:hypothetical protein